MRVAVVSSDLLSPNKRAVVDGLGKRLVGIAAVSVVPSQVGLWRHVRLLAVYAGPSGWPRLALDAAGRRLMRTFGPIVCPERAWTLRELAHRAGVSFLHARDADDPELAHWLSALRPNLVVSLQSHRVPKRLIGIPEHGWLNLHHGRLPDYRGVFSVFWAMLHKEPVLYVTAHLMTQQIDRGPVIVERAMPIEAGASVAKMEERMWTESPNVLLEAVSRIESGEVLTDAREGGSYFTYPTRTDLRKASSSGLKLR